MTEQNRKKFMSKELNKFHYLTNNILIFNFLTYFTFFSFGQEYHNCNLLDRWYSDTLLTNSSKVRYSGCWGFVINNKEYGVIGSTEGHHFFELTDDNKFKFIDFVPGRFISSQAITREYKTYHNYLYASGDEGDGSLQIIDLNYLPDSVLLVADIQNTEIGKVHNLFVDSTNSLLFACSVTPFLNGQELSLVPLKVFSIQDPINPSLLWEGPNDIFEVHDVFVKDGLAILNCGYEGIRVYNFSNPSQPVLLSNLTAYQEQGYNHQGWLAPNGKTYIFADETAGTKIKKATLNEDFSLSIQSYFGRDNVPYDKTPHNLQCNNEFVFVAYYNEGLRIYDLRSTPPMEIAYYDTHIDEPGNVFSMWGAWGIYSMLPSKRILVSDRNSGFYLFSFNQTLFAEINPDEDIQVFPNPSDINDNITLFIPYEFKKPYLTIYDLTGKKVYEKSIEFTNLVTLDSFFVSGIYMINLNYTDYLNEQKNVTKKLIIK